MKQQPLFEGIEEPKKPKIRTGKRFIGDKRVCLWCRRRIRADSKTSLCSRPVCKEMIDKCMKFDFEGEN